MILVLTSRCLCRTLPDDCESGKLGRSGDESARRHTHHRLIPALYGALLNFFILSQIHGIPAKHYVES